MTAAAGALETEGLRGLFRRMASMAGAELAGRLTRIVTAVVLARTLGSLEFGIAAAAITASELLRILTQTGIGARIIQCGADELEPVCAAAWRINWIGHVTVFLLHIAVAIPVALHFGDMRIAGLIAILALPMLVYPFAAIQVFRVQRTNDIGFTARILGFQSVTDNLLTAALALLGFGLWSIALPKLAVALGWTLLYRRHNSWRHRKLEQPLPYRTTLRFGAVVLLSEGIGALRLHADKFVVGAMASIEYLGTWFFAFNAGLGITGSVITAFATAYLPHFARLERNRDFVPQAIRALGLTLCAVAPLVLLQALLAPVYVPVVFGAKWAEAATLVGILCLSALGLPFLRLTAMVLRAAGRPQLELAGAALHAAASLAAVAVFVPQSLEAAAWALAAVNLTLAPAITGIALLLLHRQLRKAA